MPINSIRVKHLMNSRQSGQKKTEHGDQSYDDAPVLPDVVHAFLQQVQDPPRPVDAKRPAQGRVAEVRSHGHVVCPLPGEAGGRHGGTGWSLSGCLAEEAAVEKFMFDSSRNVVGVQTVVVQSAATRLVVI